MDQLRDSISIYIDCTLGLGGIDKFSTSVFLAKILRYYYIPTIGVADLQAPFNIMLRSSSELFILIKITFSQPYIYI